MLPYFKRLSPVFFGVLILVPCWAVAQEQPTPFLKEFKVQDGRSEMYETCIIAAAGDKLVLLGNGFGNKAGTVMIGQTASDILKWSETSITLTVPEGKGISRVNLTIVNTSGKQCQVMFNLVPKDEPKDKEKN